MCLLLAYVVSDAGCHCFDLVRIFVESHINCQSYLFKQVPEKIDILKHFKTESKLKNHDNFLSCFPIAFVREDWMLYIYNKH